MANDRLNFYYDPIRQGYDSTLLKTITGTPTISGGAIRMNTAKFIGYADILKEDLTLNVKIPAAPTAADSRQWGLQQINIGAKAVFNITDTVFSCICVYNGVTTTIVVPWLAAWTNTAVSYTIKWNAFSADFLINGVRPAGAYRTTSGNTTANASTTITGSGTSFLTQIKVGDLIALSSASTVYATVTAIASNTSLTVATALGDGTSQTIGVFTETFINDISVPKVPLSMMVENANADNVDVFYMEDLSVQGYI